MPWSKPSRPRHLAFTLLLPMLFLFASACAGGSGIDIGTSNDVDGGMPEAMDATMSSNPFGKPDTTPVPSLKLINDGGAEELPDGAIIYLALWARPCPPTSDATYQNFGETFFATYCLGCHSQNPSNTSSGAPQGLYFDTLDEVKQHAAQIWGMAADGNAMMPLQGAQPTAAERTRLGDFLACGAPAQ